MIKKIIFSVFEKMDTSSSTSSSSNTKIDSRKRSYFVTFWNKEYPKELPKNCKYLVTCDDETSEGKYHGHAFIYFKNPVKMTSIKKLFGNDCHVENIRCNSDAINYVKGENGKENRKTNILEHGTKPCNNGLHPMEKLLECESLDDCIEKYPDTFIKYRNGIKEVFNHKQKKNKYYKQPEVYWLYGGTGTGKTRTAMEDGAVAVSYRNGFWTDWGDNRTICIEELRGEIPYAELLKLLDGYHNYHSVNIKGGEKWIDLDKIYITSPKTPEECYPNQYIKNDSIQQLLRRITKITKMEPK